MLQDSITLLDGAVVTNLATANGTTDPSGTSPGELFFRTDLSQLRVYDGSEWVSVGSGGGGGSSRRRW